MNERERGCTRMPAAHGAVTDNAAQRFFQCTIANRTAQTTTIETVFDSHQNTSVPLRRGPALTLPILAEPGKGSQPGTAAARRVPAVVH